MKFLTKKWAETQFQNFANKVNSIFVKSNDLSTVSFSGDYNDLSEKPNIPTKISQLENDVEYAKTKSPTLTGTPKAPTPSSDTNNTQIATTAFVKTLISNLINGAPETLDTLKEIADALGENKDVVDALEEAISKKANTTDMTAALNNKVDKISGKGLSTTDYTTAEKTKLSGIAEGANKYVHPTTSGNKHIPAGGSSGKILGWSAAGTAEWKDPPSATGNYLPLSGGTLTGPINFIKTSNMNKDSDITYYGPGMLFRGLSKGLYKSYTASVDGASGEDSVEIRLPSNYVEQYLAFISGCSSNTNGNVGTDDHIAFYLFYKLIYGTTSSHIFRWRFLKLGDNSPTTSRFSLSSSTDMDYITLKTPKGSCAGMTLWNLNSSFSV